MNTNLINKIQLQNAIRLLIGGWLYDGGELDQVCEILDEIKEEYKKAIKKELKEL